MIPIVSVLAAEPAEVAPVADPEVPPVADPELAVVADPAVEVALLVLFEEELHAATPASSTAAATALRALLASRNRIVQTPLLHLGWK
jgi:hypothetical protein